MRWEVVIILLVLISILSISFAVIKVRQTKNQIAGIKEALEDIRKGNGNRRILSGTGETAADLVFSFNEIIQNYEERIAAFQRTEEANQQLMTSLSHDVRTPLTTLIGYLDAIHKGVVTDKELSDYLESARRKAYDLKDYINVLFDWFKLNSDEYVLDMTEVEITEETRNSLIDWIPVFEEKKLEYNFEIPDYPIYVYLSKDGYNRILNNLIQNIITHSQASDMRLTIEVKEKEVCVRLEDNGIGIEKNDLKHIFERLYKCDKGRAEKGSGLGLAIVKQLTEKMNGQISVESHSKHGTAFLMTFIKIK